MSAPDTNVEKQERRHAPSLWGIKGAMIFGALMIVILGFIVMSNSTGVEENEVRVPEENSVTTTAPTDG